MNTTFITMSLWTEPNGDKLVCVVLLYNHIHFGFCIFMQMIWLNLDKKQSEIVHWTVYCHSIWFIPTDTKYISVINVAMSEIQWMLWTKPNQTYFNQLPFFAARCNAVLPLLSTISTLLVPFWIKSSTIFSLPKPKLKLSTN